MRISAQGLINLFEPLDTQGGVDSESFNMAGASQVDMIVHFGAITGDAVLTVYSGATTGTKTTKVPFTYELSSADHKAAAADGFEAQVADADGDLTLTAASFDHRVIVIHVNAAALTAGEPWVTVQISSAASVLLMSGVAILHGHRYSGVTAVDTA